MSIQQGTGYGFNSNGKSFTINVNQPWVDYCDIAAPPPEEGRPLQFQIDVTNLALTPADPPEWFLTVVPGVVITAPIGTSTCIHAEWIEDIDARCDPVGGGIEDPESPTAVYLFRITTDGTSEFILWVGPEGDYTPGCPVSLPDNIAPAGTYKAQAQRVGDATLSDGVWTINQVLQGTITFPDYIDNSHPFKVRLKGSIPVSGPVTYTVETGAVNNSIPTNVTDDVEVDISHDNFIFIQTYVGAGTPGIFPDPDTLTIEVDTTPSVDSSTSASVAIAKIDSGTGKVHQLVTGSLWGSRISYGTYYKYYWARI